MKTLALTLILALSTPQAFAWGYRGHRARAFYNPWPSSGPFIAGAGHPSSPQYGRALRGHWGGYRAYGGGGGMGWYWQQRQTWALEGIEAELRWGDLK